MKALLVLLLSGAVLASTSCYEGDFMSPGNHYNIVDSPVGSCVLMFEADDFCDPSSTNSSLQLRAEPAMYKNKDCWMPYPNQIWCYCSQPLCNDNKAMWWLDQIMNTSVNTTDHQRTKNCVLSYIESLTAPSYETSSNRPRAESWKEKFGWVPPKASGMVNIALGTLLITNI